MRLRIICVGNSLHGSDGVGHAVFHELQRHTLPNTVEVIDGGIGGLTLIPFFRDCERVLLVDAVSEQTLDGEGNFIVLENAHKYLVDSTTTTAEHGGDLTALAGVLPVYLPVVPQVDLLCIAMPEPEYFQPVGALTFYDLVQQVCESVCEYVRQFYDQCTASPARENM